MSDVGRQLYDAGFEGWGHSIAGYVTDYLLSLTCIVCFVYVITQRRPLADAASVSTSFLVFLGFEAVAFLAGGITHHVLDTYFRSGEVMGRTWNSWNSGWMPFWMIAMFCSPLATMALNCVVFIFKNYPPWTTYLSYSIGVVASVCECWLVYHAKFSSSGTVNSALAIGTCVLAGVLLLQGFEIGPQGGRAFMLWGMLLRLVGFLVLALAPNSCKQVDSFRDGCPFPENFNQNAVFHSLLIVATIAQCKAVIDRDVSEYFSSPQLRYRDVKAQFDDSGPGRRGDCRSCQCAVQ